MLTLGRLEDPSFTLKTAIITTPYPGANAEQVEQEVTERLESAIQQLPAVDYVRSRSRPGISEVEVEIKRAYPSRNMPQLWDELRRKIGDAQASLPRAPALPWSTTTSATSTVSTTQSPRRN
ncbi:efflux RND transporter permease subunit [Billgrantia tianxiuensis]|uniref:efflux RND transporter permease subunit n=1 Tax=Billgrantia tianxiuensis TaxID=2497861 RepID=UPI0030EC4A2A